MAHRTKARLAASLRKLLKDNTINKIRISDIVEDCELNRQTFYYHFKNIYELAEYLITSDLNEVFKVHPTETTWKDRLNKTFEYLLDNRIYVMNIYSTSSHSKLTNAVIHILRDVIYDVALKKKGDLQISDDDLNFVVDYYVFGFCGFLMEWLAGEMTTDYHILSDKTDIMLSNTMHRTLARFDPNAGEN